MEAKNDYDARIYDGENVNLMAPHLNGEDDHDPHFINYPTGALMRAETFGKQRGVHLPMAEYINSGFSRLRITDDAMQTAVDAFSIIIYGNIDDVERLPADYVLASARTIAMLKIPREKMVAMWKAVKRPYDFVDNVPFETLEKFRPLFRYVNAKDMARLNMTNPKIVSYLGSHPDLDRHQVGVLAAAYIIANPNWAAPENLNTMKNLMCGIPITLMRKIPFSTYLQLNFQIFYHIKACDQLQKRFFLGLMTKSQVLGKSFSWSARDVTRLGLLITQLSGKDLSSIYPQAMAGLTSQVMEAIPVESLLYLTDVQLQFIPQKALNILQRKISEYQERIKRYTLNTAAASSLPNLQTVWRVLIVINTII